jgi:small subunit ribosomal protein S18
MRGTKKKKPKVSGGRARCPICRENWEPGWRKVEKVREFLSARAKISSRAYTRVCAKHQRSLAQAIKQLRHLGLLPFVAASSQEKN